MYKARIVTDAGRSFDFSYANGVLFDVSPLSGVEVGIAVSQGFRQVGETVEYQSVGGIYRTISGRLLSKDAARRMLSVLGAFTEGKLYVNDAYYCPIVLASTPQISQKKTGDIPFLLRVFCPSPYWYAADGKSVLLNDYTPAFSFPVLYDSHVYGVEGGSAFVNVYNEGDAEADMEIVFRSEGVSENFGVANVLTGEILRFGGTLSEGETVTLRRVGGRVTAIRRNGTEESDVLRDVSDDSNLFTLHAGDNVLRVTADAGEEVLRASISFHAAYMGVIV